MDFIEWTDELVIGISSIDEQHRKLVDLINQFYQESRDGEEKALPNILAGLIEYAGHHFKYEEELMERFGFSDSDAHTRSHQGFKDQVEALEERFVQGQAVSVEEISDFLKDWLIKHIQGSDRKYIDLFISNGLK